MIATSTLKSVGVIQEKSGRYILPIPRKNLVYVIPENKLQLLYLLRNRYILLIIITFFIYSFTKLDLYVQFAIAVFVLILLEFYYRKVLLGKFVQINNYIVASIRLEKTENTKTKWIHMALYIILAIAVSYLGFTKYSDSYLLYLYQIGAVFALVFGYFGVFKSPKK